MIERDGCDGGHLRSYDVGRVQPAAESDFDDRELDPSPAKQLEGDRRGDLEERGLDVERALLPQPVDRSLHVRDGGGQRSVVNRMAIDYEALVERDQMRGRVAPDAISRRTQSSVDHRGDRSLAVGPRDVQRPKRALGVAQAADDGAHVGEAELDPELLEAEQIGERIQDG